MYSSDGCRHTWRVAFCRCVTCPSVKVCQHDPELSHLWTVFRATQCCVENGIIQHLAGTALASFSCQWCCHVQMSLHTRLRSCCVHIFKYERAERPSLPLWCTQSTCGKHSLSSVRYFRGQPVERDSQYVAWKQLLPHPGCAAKACFQWEALI